MSERDSTREIREATLQVLERFPGLLGIRQIWYRLISPPFQILPQTQNSYKGFDRMTVRWRENGDIDPERIADESTFPTGGENGFGSTSEFLDYLVNSVVADNYERNRWSSQEVVPILYIEKSTLTRVLESRIGDLGVVIYPTRGVTSFTKLWNLAKRKRVHVLHLTDHDATGVFMGEDFRRRLNRYGGADIPVTRIALTTEQVRKFRLPPNPVHPKDSRSPVYVKRFGNRAWELDALPPDEFGRIVRSEIVDFIDKAKWDAVEDLQRAERRRLERPLVAVRVLLRKILALEEKSQ